MAFLLQVRFYRDWYDVVSNAMKSNPSQELTLSDMREYFEKSGELFGEEPYDSGKSDHYHGVIEALETVLPAFQKWGLIEARYDRDRYTPNLGLPVPTTVGKLAKRGECLAERGLLGKNLYFATVLATYRVIAWAKRFRFAVAVGTTVLGVSKLVLEWDTLEAAAAMIIATVIVGLLTELIGGFE
ncbi:hypothetical protein AB1P65_22890 [Roseibium alexandrii]